MDALPTLRGVNHYDAHFGLLLSDREKDDLIEYLKILVTRRSMAIEHLAGQRTAAGARSRSGVCLTHLAPDCSTLRPLVCESATQNQERGVQAV